MSSLPLLQFRPVLQHYLWGGERLNRLFGKPTMVGQVVAESWEVVDHPAAQSVVVSGPLAGTTLGSLVGEQGSALLGRHAPQPRFPLLLKLLDCQRDLSVQVHPSDEQGARLNPPDLGKTEAWVVLAAEPGSRIFAGLKTGVDRHQLASAVAAGDCETCLHSFEPQVGDCVLIPAGTVHALGAGLVIAEIQQASNTTFRLFDWNRVDADGKPRQLHIEESLTVTDFGRGPVGPVRPGMPDARGRQQLVACEKFTAWRWLLASGAMAATDGEFRILLVTHGAARVEAEGGSLSLAAGQTVLIPASTSHFRLTPEPSAEVLEFGGPSR